MPAVILLTTSSASKMSNQAVRQFTSVELPANATSQHLLTNPINQECYVIQISYPLNLSKALSIRKNKLPVIYVLDGNALFLTASEICWRRETSPFWSGGGIVVAIGYPPHHDPEGKTYLHNFSRRNYDYTLPTTSYPNRGRFGGIDTFLEFVKKQARELVQQQLPHIEIEKEAFFGHSFGGLCVLYALFDGAGGLFDTYFAVSPSIWFGEKCIMSKEEDFCRGSSSDIGAHRPCLDLSFGSLENETKYDPKATTEQFEKRREERAERNIGGNTRDMHERLRGSANLRGVNLTEFDGEDHGTVVTVGLLRALTKFFETP